MDNKVDGQTDSSARITLNEWTSYKTLKLQARERSSTRQSIVHMGNYTTDEIGGGGNAKTNTTTRRVEGGVVKKPILTITAIGQSTITTGGGSGGGASVTVGGEGEDPPLTSSKGDLFYDIDDNTLKINKDGSGNAESWVGVGGGGGGLKSSQVLEYISSPLDGSIIKTNNSGNITLRNITSSCNKITTSLTEETLINYIPPSILNRF